MKTAIYNMQTNGIAMSEKNLFSFFLKTFIFKSTWLVVVAVGELKDWLNW
jgi:hypothetical protein